MIAALTLLYVGLLFLAVKLKLIQLTLWWKLSPVIWIVFLNVALIIPMQFYAPGGNVLVAQYTVQIVPNVAGQVIDVPVEPNTPLSKGDVLFRIEPTPFQAAVDDLLAQRHLAETRLNQAQTLSDRGVGSDYEVENFKAQIEQIDAGLDRARFNLDQTVVRAPGDGYVTNVALRAGARVANFPAGGVMAFVETGRPIVAMQVFQKDLRYIAPGQSAEIALKMYPGRIFNANVVRVMPASSIGMQAPSGSAATPSQVVHAPMWVRLELDDLPEIRELPVGASGTGAIYTDKGAPTQIIRRVMVRMDAILNYLLPT